MEYNNKISKLLGITEQELNSRIIEGINATYYYDSSRGGKHVIVDENGTYLLAGSATNYERLLEEFNHGRRNGNLKSLICPNCGAVLDIMMPDGKVLNCPKCNKFYIYDNGTVGEEPSSPYNKGNVLY